MKLTMNMSCRWIHAGASCDEIQKKKEENLFLMTETMLVKTCFKRNLIESGQSDSMYKSTTNFPVPKTTYAVTVKAPKHTTKDDLG